MCTSPLAAYIVRSTSTHSEYSTELVKPNCIDKASLEGIATHGAQIIGERRL